MKTFVVKYMIIGVAILFLALGSQAQELQKQAGFRFGNTTGFTCKFIKDNNFAMETILGFRNHGAQLYVLFESRRPVFTNKMENMYLYFGGGVHAGYVKWSDYDYYDDPFYHQDYYHHNYYNHTGPAFGLDGVLGLEYGFNSVPITLAADFKPFVEIYGPFYGRVNFWDFGFHIRYNF